MLPVNKSKAFFCQCETKKHTKRKPPKRKADLKERNNIVFKLFSNCFLKINFCLYMQSKSTNLESKISAPKNTKEKLQKEYHAVLASQYK